MREVAALFVRADEAKRLATLQARAALKGYELQADPLGGFYATRWGHLKLFDSLEDFERWFAFVTGGKAA